MTVGGLYGSDIEAQDHDEAEFKADAAGYVVLDLVEHGGELVLVVAD